MSEIEYFNTTGESNSKRTLEISFQRLLARDIKNVVIASSYGNTAMLASDEFRDLPVRIISIGIDRNWDEKVRLASEVQHELEKRGQVICKGSMPFEYYRFSKDSGVKLIANTLRRFGEGMKVCVEIILMAVSGELIQKGEKVLAIAGTHRGADTAIVATASSLYHFEQFEINEILCKPYSLGREG
jgi:uncharacterized protein